MTCSGCRIDPDLHARIEAALADSSSTERERGELVASALERDPLPLPRRRRRTRLLVAAAALAGFTLAWLAFRPAGEVPVPAGPGNVAEERAANTRVLPKVKDQLIQARGLWAVIAAGKLVRTSKDLGALLKEADKLAPKAVHRFVFRAGKEGDVEYETLHDGGPMAGMDFLQAAELKLWEDPAAGKGVFRYEGGKLLANVSIGDFGPVKRIRSVDFEVVTGFTGPLLLPADLAYPRFEIPGRARVKIGKKVIQCRRYSVAAGVRTSFYDVEALGRLGPAGPEPAPFEWVRIPGGTFRSGEPGHTETVELDAFEIMKYEVTNRQWWDYLRAEEKRLRRMEWFLASVPRSWGFDPEQDPFPIVPDGLANRPVVHITWHMANDFCRNYLPKRLGCAGAWLPTGAQWERAARGAEDERRYPWGDDTLLEVNGLQIPAANVRESGNREPVDVRSFPRDLSPDGVFGLGGNVSEFVGLVFQRRMAYRGGSFEDPAVDAAVHYETLVPTNQPFTWRSVGFRAVRSIDE